MRECWRDRRRARLKPCGVALKLHKSQIELERGERNWPNREKQRDAGKKHMKQLQQSFYSPLPTAAAAYVKRARRRAAPKRVKTGDAGEQLRDRRHEKRRADFDG